MFGVRNALEPDGLRSSDGCCVGTLSNSLTHSAINWCFVIRYWRLINEE